LPPRDASNASRGRTISSLTRELARASDRCRTIIDSLQVALAIELATLPPYLTAYWSVIHGGDTAAKLIRSIYREEMWHVGRICNLIAGLKAHPSLVAQNPTYPGPIPGGVQAGLQISLTALSTASAFTFMQIERPAFDPLARLMATDGGDPTTIGEFYAAIIKAIEVEKPTFFPERQLDSDPVVPVSDYKGAIDSIRVIQEEGEGSEKSPQQPDGDNAHYYDFAAIHHRAKLRRQGDGTWAFNGDPIPMPATHPIGEVPMGGYDPEKAPDDVKKALLAFDGLWTSLLTHLEKTWAGDTADEVAFSDAVTSMQGLRKAAVALMVMPKGDGTGNYAPCFRILK